MPVLSLSQVHEILTIRPESHQNRLKSFYPNTNGYRGKMLERHTQARQPRVEPAHNVVIERMRFGRLCKYGYRFLGTTFGHPCKTEQHETFALPRPGADLVVACEQDAVEGAIHHLSQPEAAVVKAQKWALSVTPW